MTLTQANDYFSQMVRDVSLNSNVLFASILDYSKTAAIICSGTVEIRFFIEAAKAFEKIMILDLEDEKFEAERNSAWSVFLSHYAKLKE